MSFLPILSYKEMKILMRRLVYFPVRQKGSHVIFENVSGNTITIPNHSGRMLGKGLLRNLIRDLDMTVDEFMSLYKG